jgi:hypothetical protein
MYIKQIIMRPNTDVLKTIKDVKYKHKMLLWVLMLL